MKVKFRINWLASFWLCLMTMIVASPILEARGDHGGKRGGSRPKARSSSHAKPKSHARPKTPSRSKPKASRPKSSSHRAPMTSSRPKSKSYSRPSTSHKATKPQARPSTKPAAKPKPRPSTKPTAKPKPRPSTKPSSRPSTKPSNKARPSVKPGDTKYAKPSVGIDGRPINKKPSTRPSTKPGDKTKPSTRPVKPGDKTKPSTRPSKPGEGGAGVRPTPKPGDKTRPTPRPGGGDKDRPVKPNRPNKPDGDKDRPGGGNKPDIGNRPNRPDSANRPNRPNKPDVGKRPNRPNRPDRPSHGKPIAKPPIAGKPGRPGHRPGHKPNRPGNRPGVGHRPGYRPGRDVDINFTRNYNWSVDYRHWGGRPWWGAGSYYPWHRGHWHYGYHYRPYYYPVGRAFAWGLVGWGIGNLIFDCGYHSYYNPYPTQTVVVYNDSGNSSMNYSEPVTVAAESAVQQRSDMSQEESDSIAEKASKAFDEARVAFKNKDYLAASKKVDEAISFDPGDTVQHEFKALCLFALQKYGDAASVLNSVLSGSPGWGWDTMIDQYDSSSTYEAQLRALEDYAQKSPKAADAQFLLGYHYMTAGFLEEAADAFAKCIELQPRDQVAKQLYQLTSTSTTGETDDSNLPTDPAKEYNPPPLDSIHGKWTSKTDKGTITLSISDDDKFVWNYDDGKKPFKMEGNASMDDGLLVLSDDESQIVAAIEMKDDTTLNFIVAGGTEGDPGIDFKKS